MASLLVTGLVASSAQAAVSVGVQIGNDSPLGVFLTSADSAGVGVVAQTNWQLAKGTPDAFWKAWPYSNSGVETQMTVTRDPGSQGASSWAGSNTATLTTEQKGSPPKSLVTVVLAGKHPHCRPPNAVFVVLNQAVSAGLAESQQKLAMTGDQKLASMQFADTSSQVFQLYVKAIPYAMYDVYVYGESDVVGTPSIYQLSPEGGTPVFAGFTSLNAGTDWADWNGWVAGVSATSATDTSSIAGHAGNYVKFSGLTTPRFTLNPYAQTGAGNVAFNGIQIVEAVPEPAALSLLGASLCMLVRRRKA